MELTFRSRRYISTIVTEVTQLCVLTTTLLPQPPVRHHHCAKKKSLGYGISVYFQLVSSRLFFLRRRKKKKKIFKPQRNACREAPFPFAWDFPSSVRMEPVVYRDSQGMKSQAASSYIFSFLSMQSGHLARRGHKDPFDSDEGVGYL